MTVNNEDHALQSMQFSHLPNVQSKTYASHFSYHKPKISTMPIETSTNKPMEIEGLEQNNKNIFKNLF